MRILAAILALCLAINAQATLTITARGTVTNNSAATTFVCSPGSTIAAGTMGIIVVSTDNATGAGATAMFTDATKTDSVGNTWTRRENNVYDPGSNSAGIAIAIFTATITTQVTTGDNLTLNLAASTTPKTAAFWEVSTTAASVAYNASGIECAGCTTGNTGTAVQMTTGSITNTNAVICMMGAEDVQTVTADSDTTNGSWNTQQRNTAGTLTTGCQVASQGKVVTGTGTQSYDLTLGGSSDWNAAWVEVKEVTTQVKTVMDLANASVKTVTDLARASVKSIMGLP